MSAQPEPAPGREGAAEPRVFCRRLLEMRPLAEHLECPYCFGKDPDLVRSRDYDLFCEYRQGQDPAHFGFPEDRGRDLRA